MMTKATQILDHVVFCILLFSVYLKLIVYTYTTVKQQYTKYDTYLNKRNNEPLSVCFPFHKPQFWILWQPKIGL